MSTTYAVPVTGPAAPAAAANAEQMNALLTERSAGRRLADKVTAAPRALKAWVAATLRTFHLDAAAGSVADAGRWTWERLSGVFSFVAGFGATNLAGIVVTTPLRRTFVRVTTTVLTVVTAPIRWVGRLLRWGMNKFGPTRKIVETVQRTVTRVSKAIDAKVEQGLTWLERNDDHGAMTWLRWFFQARVVRHALALAFPAIPGWAVYAGSLLVPVYGDSAHEATAAENEAIGKAKDMLSKVPTREHVIEDVVEEVISSPKAKQEGPHMTTEIVILTDTDPEGPWGAGTNEAYSFVDESGVRRIRLGSQLFLEDDLPDTMTLVGTVTGTGPLVQEGEAKNEIEAATLEMEVRAAQASNRGRPPKLPRAAQSGRGGTGTTRGRKAAAAAS